SARLRLQRRLDPVEVAGRLCGLRRQHDDERFWVEGTTGVDRPVHQPPAKQRMQVLRKLRAQASPQACGHHDGGEGLLLRSHGRNGWGARIRTWDRGTKTRCLTTWLRPTACESARTPVS